MLKEGMAKVRVAFASSYLLGQLWKSQAPHSHHVLPQSRLIPGRSELLGVGWLWTAERDGGGKTPEGTGILHLMHTSMDLLLGVLGVPPW